MASIKHMGKHTKFSTFFPTPCLLAFFCATSIFFLCYRIHRHPHHFCTHTQTHSTPAILFKCLLHHWHCVFFSSFDGNRIASMSLASCSATNFPSPQSPPYTFWYEYFCSHLTKYFFLILQHLIPIKLDKYSNRANVSRTLRQQRAGKRAYSKAHTHIV